MLVEALMFGSDLWDLAVADWLSKLLGRGRVWSRLVLANQDSSPTISKEIWLKQ
jgi:hypothetical protein